MSTVSEELKIILKKNFIVVFQHIKELKEKSTLVDTDIHSIPCVLTIKIPRNTRK